MSCRSIMYSAQKSADMMERMTGIEPARSAWEAEVLPLNYIRILDNILARSRCFVKENFIFYVSRLEGRQGNGIDKRDR